MKNFTTTAISEQQQTSNTTQPKTSYEPSTTEQQLEEINKDNNVLKYNINNTVFSEINENVIKMFGFNQNTSKLFLKLDMRLNAPDLSNYNKNVVSVEILFHQITKSKHGQHFFNKNQEMEMILINVLIFAKKIPNVKVFL